MSRQLSLDSFFKTTSKMNNFEPKNVEPLRKQTKKKRNLSLVKPESPKKSSTTHVKPKESSKENIVNLCSDDEESANDSHMADATQNISQISTDSGDVSSDSQKTIIYASTPRSPISPRTPRRTPMSTPHSKSPGSNNKFFSPSRKRAVSKRTPVKRKLEQDFIKCTNPAIHNDIFIEACKGMDDKTVALLTIINQYLNNESLKNLLSKESQVLLEKCLHVVKPGMRLVCRLYWRKEGWFKRSQVKSIAADDKTMEDPLFCEMLNSLIASGLIVHGFVNGCNEGNMTFEDLTSVLSAEELKQICKDLKLKIQNKQSAIDSLKSYSRRSSIGNIFKGSSETNAARVLKIMSNKAGLCYKLANTARATLYRLYVLMYLGINYSVIREKKLELTIIYDKIKRETYPVDKNMQLDDASVVFDNKEQFDRYMDAHCINEEFMELTDLSQKYDIITKVYKLYQEICEETMISYKSLPLWLRRYTPPNIFVKILEAGITDLKKFKTEEHYLLAVDILSTLINQIAFRQHKKAEWYSEKALILYFMDCNDEAAEVLLEAFKSNLPEDAKDSLRPRVCKIANRASEFLKKELLEYAHKETAMEKNLRGVHIYKQPMDRISSRGKLKFESRDVTDLVVEEAEEYCLRQYLISGEFTDGRHWEGRVITTIFFLLFWDIIYTKPRGAVGIFLSHFQMYPLDMFCESFYSNRKTLIEERLKTIEACTTDELIDIIDKKWTSRDDCELSGVWRGVETESLYAVVHCLGPRAAAALCRRLARDYRYAHSGFPDLTLWNLHTGTIRFVEVKTDSDKPSMKQIQWMHYLQQNGIDTEFCYVGAHTTRSRARPS